MLLLVSGATRDVAADPDLGELVTPRAQSRPESLRLLPGRWGADNSAFSGFDARLFVAMLEAFSPWAAGCLFAAAPDVVGDWEGTMRQFHPWRGVIRAYGFKVALVLQDGMTDALVPWDDVDAVFLGGSTGFKLGAVARGIVGHAVRRGLWAHMGRVNTRRRFRYAEDIGCGSTDGTYFSRWPKVGLPKARAWAEQRRANPRLL